MRPRTLTRSRRGLTLIEIAFAMGLLAIFMLAISATYGVSHSATVLSREHQAASNAALQQLDVVLSTPELDTIPRSGGADIEAYAFHVPYGSSTLVPADASFEPLNPNATADRAGHVRVTEVDADGDGTPEDYNGDGLADLIEVQVVVAWRSGALSGDTPFSRVQLTARRTQ